MLRLDFVISSDFRILFSRFDTIQHPKYNQIIFEQLAPYDCVKINIKLFDILWQDKVHSDCEMFCGVDQKLGKKSIYELFFYIDLFMYNELFFIIKHFLRIIRNEHDFFQENSTCGLKLIYL